MKIEFLHAPLCLLFQIIKAADIVMEVSRASVSVRSYTLLFIMSTTQIKLKWFYSSHHPTWVSRMHVIYCLASCSDSIPSISDCVTPTSNLQYNCDKYKRCNHDQVWIQEQRNLHCNKRRIQCLCFSITGTSSSRWVLWCPLVKTIQLYS